MNNRTPLSQFIKNKNNFCLIYNGHCSEYLVQLDILRPYIERRYPDISYFICCRDEYRYILDDNIKNITISKFDKKEFGLIQNLKSDGRKHPVADFISNLDLQISKIPNHKNDSNICLICPESVPPGVSLSYNQITSIKKTINNMQIVIVGSDIHKNEPTIYYRPYMKEKLSLVKNVGLAIGVSNDIMYLCAKSGIPTIVVNNQYDLDIYTTLFETRILELENNEGN